jgi:putative flippase GtrA
MFNSLSKSRFVKFALVGLSGTVVDVGISNFLRFFLHLPEIPSITISFFLAVLNNFHWNRVWTYPELRNNEIGKQLIKFTLISIIGYIIRTPLFSILEPSVLDYFKTISFGIFPLSNEVIAHNATLGIVIIIVLFWNYFANRIWTYRDFSNGDIHEI